MIAQRPTAALALSAIALCSFVVPTTHATPSHIAPDVSSIHIQSQGKILFGRLFSPALESAQAKAPSVLMLHGIPGTEQNFDVAYALRDAGFNCLLWHYRGCWGSEGSYSIDGLEEDIDAAFRWFRALPSVDEERVVVVGHSLGGYHALRLAIESARGSGVRLRGVVALCPLVATASAGVPLEDGLAREFAKMLTDVDPQTLQTQWAELVSVKQRLAHVAKAGEDEHKGKSKLPLLVITGDEDPLFSPRYYVEHLEAPLRDARVRNMIESRWVRFRFGDHALCRYRRQLVLQVVKFARKCAGVSAPVNLVRLGRSLLSSRGLLDTVPLMLIASAVTGFIGGQYSATPEGAEAARRHREALDERRRQALPSPKAHYRL